MNRVALALTLLLVAACDLSVSTSSIDIDAGAELADGGSAQCGQNPCLNGGECTLTNDGFTCTCQPGYEGEHCETDVDDCRPNPCLNAGICKDGVASYTCTCASGFEGVDCSTNIDDCAGAPCLNNGTCTDKINGYQCDCAAGYSGTQCEVDVDDCSPNPCQYNGVCVDAVNGFTCVCKEGHSGVTCTDTVETCKADTCQNGGTCENGPEGYSCTCAPGFNGTNCETDIDDCATTPCENGAICTDKVNGYTCQCPEGMTGVNCENSLNPCDPNPCLNGGECASSGSDSYVCSCAAGYKGAACEIDIDDCASNPCSNGGICTDGVNGFTCECPTGYSGSTCNSEPPSCPAVDPCENGTCKEGVDGFKCECDPGFMGVLCEVNVDDCDPDPCDHGTCVDGANSFTCECDAGYEGAACEINTDDCVNVLCLHGGTCVDEVAGFTCDCAAGYAGADCSANIDDCTAQSCMNGGTCVDGVNSFTCDCPHLFSGDHCEINECSLVGVCSGHGMCDGQGGCACSAGWQGTDCELNIDECTPTNPCEHGGQCTDTDGSFSCSCATGYQGMTCSACDTGYQDDDHNDVCCRIGYEGAACDQCQTGYEKINGVCQKTCQSTGLQCGAHGMCNDNAGDPVCECEATYFGPACDSLQGTCSVSACSGQGACSATSDNSYLCTCDPAYVGRSCDTHDDCVAAVLMGVTPCSGNGQCIDGNNTYTCQCQAGWLGAACDNPDDCYAATQNGQAPCNNHGMCVDGTMTYTCTCDADWSGAHCDNHDDCVGNACQHAGMCVDGNNAYTCDCSGTGYQGTFCETKVDLCMNAPCQNGGTCTDLGATFQCDCTNTGYTGTTCQTDIDECAANTSLCNTGVCTNASGGYTCQCPDGLLDVDGDGKNCSSVAQLSAGELNTCAITTAGSLHCWGDNSYGQLVTGNTAVPAQRLPKRIGQPSGWQAVSVGGGHICAIRSGHLYCWGNNSLSQTAPPDFSDVYTLREVRTDLTWSAVSSGDTHTCGISAGSLYCWGNSADGQAGTPITGTMIRAPQQIAGTYLAVSAGGNHTCWITSTNQLQCIGNDSSGQLGGATQPIPAPSGSWSAVKAGPTHTCATAGATTYCWGAGTQGELGNGMTSDSSAPVQVSTVTGMSSLGTGQDFSCGLVQDADAAASFQLYCWGTNANGLLLTNDVFVDAPQLVTRGSSTWSAYAVGKTHMCGVDNGLLVCWGSNADGALGTGSTNATPNNAPAAVKASVVTYWASNNCSSNPCQNGGICTSAASGFTCDCTNTGFGGATCTSETDECTQTPGICGEGVCADLLGNQGYTCKCPDGMIDVDQTGMNCAKVQTIAAGTNHSCVITEDKTLHCWGTNRYGQLGLGMTGTTAYYPDETPQSIRTPLRLTTVSGISGAVSGWTKLVVGENHTCATRPSGAGKDELYCWGDNSLGQVGVGSGGSVPAPLLLDNTQNWIALAAGYSHTCGVVSSGAMYCWGYSNRGQVGNGASTGTPQAFSLARAVDVPMGENAWVSVAGGGTHTCATTNSQSTYCWGRNAFGAGLGPPYAGLQGQVGNGAVTNGDVLVPTKVALGGTQSFTSVTAEWAHSCSLTSTGSVYCWGYNGSGGLGIGSYATPQTSPVMVATALSFEKLESGIDFSCGLLPVNASTPQAYDAYCWGTNANNLFLTAGASFNVPTHVTTQQWEQFSVGTTHVCAVDHADGLLYCWGDNGNENGAGTGKLGYVPEGVIGNFGMGAVKAAARTYPASN